MCHGLTLLAGKLPVGKVLDWEDCWESLPEGSSMVKEAPFPWVTWNKHW